MSVIFERGNANMVSDIFTAPTILTAYNMTSSQCEIDDKEFIEIKNNTSNGNNFEETEQVIKTKNPHFGMVKEIKCGDHITFEKVLTASDYDVDCKGDIYSDGIIASTALLDECCEPIKLTACNNIVEINIKGNFRAIYHGDNRSEIIVTADRT